MAADIDIALVAEASQPNAPPHRPFRTRPSGVYIQAVVERIAETGEPEKVTTLYQGKIDRGAKFHILRKISIDRRKRPNGDLAPCPRCGCEDKFLDGALVWFFDLQFCAVIGHCCGTHEAIDAAEREFKAREKRDYEEDYLLAGLPKLTTKAALLAQLRAPAEEALRVYREFRRNAPAIHQHLRDLKAQRGGELRLYEILRSAEDEEQSDYVGPAGFRGRGGSETESRTIDFGFIAGQTAVERDFNPIKQLDTTIRVLDSFDARPSEEEAVDLICDMTDAQRRAAVAILQGVDSGYRKLTDKLDDFWRFFTRSNIERLKAYGAHPENHFPFDASYRADHGRTLVVLEHQRVKCRLSFADKFAAFTVDWPSTSDQRAAFS